MDFLKTMDARLEAYRLGFTQGETLAKTTPIVGETLEDTVSLLYEVEALVRPLEVQYTLDCLYSESLLSEPSYYEGFYKGVKNAIA